MVNLGNKGGLGTKIKKVKQLQQILNKIKTQHQKTLATKPITALCFIYYTLKK